MEHKEDVVAPVLGRVETQNAGSGLAIVSPRRQGEGGGGGGVIPDDSWKGRGSSILKRSGGENKPSIEWVMDESEAPPALNNNITSAATLSTYTSNIDRNFVSPADFELVKGDRKEEEDDDDENKNSSNNNNPRLVLKDSREHLRQAPSAQRKKQSQPPPPPPPLSHGRWGTIATSMMLLLAEAWCAAAWPVSMGIASMVDGGGGSAWMIGFGVFAVMVFPVYAVTAFNHVPPRFVGSIPLYDLVFRDGIQTGKPVTYVLESKKMCWGRLAAQCLGGIAGYLVLQKLFPGGYALLMNHYARISANLDSQQYQSTQYAFVQYVGWKLFCNSVLCALGLMCRRNMNNMSVGLAFLSSGLPLLPIIAYPELGIAFTFGSWIWMERVFQFQSVVCMVFMFAGLVPELVLGTILEDLIYSTSMNARAQSIHAATTKKKKNK